MFLLLAVMLQKAGKMMHLIQPIVQDQALQHKLKTKEIEEADPLMIREARKELVVT